MESKDKGIQTNVDPQTNYDKIINKGKMKSDSIVKEAKVQAEEIRRKAEEDARILIEDAHKEAKKIIEDSKKRGYEEGYELGYTEGKEESDKLISEANSIKEGYLNERKLVLDTIEKDVIDLIINISEKVINMKLEEDKEAILSMISKGLDGLNISDSLVIRVSKEDYDIVELSKNKVLAMANLVENIDIKIDSSLKKGDCIIESSNGTVDVGFKTQMDNVKKILLETLNSE